MIIIIKHIYIKITCRLYIIVCCISEFSSVKVSFRVHLSDLSCISVIKFVSFMEKFYLFLNSFRAISSKYID